MHEMNYHIFSYSNDVIVEIDNALIDDGIEELLHNPNASLTFQALFLNGTINHNQVQLEQLEIIDSNDNTSHFTYTFPITSLTGLIISEIIMAFAHQYFS
jgi:5-carboxymethyl-2-hydroxymuconate isomerase